MKKLFLILAFLNVIAFVKPLIAQEGEAIRIGPGVGGGYAPIADTTLWTLSGTDIYNKNSGEVQISDNLGFNTTGGTIQFNGHANNKVYDGSSTLYLSGKSNIYQYIGGALTASLNSSRFSTDSLEITGGVNIAGSVTAIAQSTTPINVTATSYTTTGNEEIISVSYTATDTCAIFLDTDELTSKRKLVVKDAGGNASGNNINIYTSLSATIDGSHKYTISSDYEAINLYSDGSNWFIY